MIDYRESGKRICQIREMRGYTRKCLSEMVHISSKYLYEIETGRKKYSLKVLYNICKSLDISADYILFEKNDYYDASIARIMNYIVKNKKKDWGLFC